VRGRHRGAYDRETIQTRFWMKDLSSHGFAGDGQSPFVIPTLDDARRRRRCLIFMGRRQQMLRWARKGIAGWWWRYGDHWDWIGAGAVGVQSLEKLYGRWWRGKGKLCSSIRRPEKIEALHACTEKIAGCVGKTSRASEKGSEGLRAFCDYGA